MQNFNGMNDIMGMMQQFGMNGNGMQKYLQAFNQLQSQNVQPGNMFQAYQQFRKNLGLQGEVTQEQFQNFQNQMNSMSPEQLNQMKSMINGQGNPMGGMQ